jgi:hypothetical protein
MKYIAKAKSANRFKTYESITEFDVSDFEGYDLFEVKELDKNKYGDALKQQKISELKDQLADLGVDLNSLMQPQQAQQNQVLTEKSSKSTESPLLMADTVDTTGDRKSKVQKPDGSLFTMQEITDAFYKVKDQIEKDFPEIMYGSFDETGIIFTVTEAARNLPKQLPNGIPMRQIAG